MKNGIISKHLVADDATVLVVKKEEGFIPVAIWATAWVSATATFGLRLADGTDDANASYKVTDDTAVTLVDDKWNSIPEVLGRKLVCADWEIIFASTEGAGPFTCQIAWAPLVGI
jgi:hypothetical protein